jgi:acetyl-CoA carboxylase carboxyl transferase subunit beta
VSRIGALALRDAVLDEGSFRSWDSPPLEVGADEAYRRELAAASARTGLDESVVTGEGTVLGRRVALVACEFDFLAGSIGVAAAERITSAVQRATAERLPLLASPSSGGTRMQEGTVAFLQMVKIAAAVELHKQQHLPYLVYLRHPTTGGVFASWGSLGHVTAAEPGALVGFLGPRRREPAPARRHRRCRSPCGVALDAGSHAQGGRRSAGAAAGQARNRASARRARVDVGRSVATPRPSRRRISVAARHN